MPALALLHPLPHIDWLHWTIHWSTVVGIVGLGGLYWWGMKAVGSAQWAGAPWADGSRRRTAHSRGSGAAERFPSPRSHPPRGHPPTARQRLSFLAGLLVLFASLNGPIHDLSDYYLFSAHMVQHLLLTMLVTPLLIFGTPAQMLRPLIAHPRAAAIARRLTSPVACFAIFNVTFMAWHLPPLYNLAMAHHGVHIGQHLCFLATSVIMWWPIMSRMPELPRLSYPLQMLYVFLLMIPMSVIGIFITYANRLLYSAYENSPRIWRLSPMDDQLVGGLIMWIPGSLILIGVLTIVFFRWAATESDETAAAQVVEAGSTGSRQ